jgi:hypothetical protein
MVASRFPSQEEPNSTLLGYGEHVNNIPFVGCGKRNGGTICNNKITRKRIDRERQGF